MWFGFVGAAVCVFLLWAIWYASKVSTRNRVQDMSRKGFEYCGSFSMGALWFKDGEVYLASQYNLAKDDEHIRIEIIKVSEVTIGTKLHELEVRYRENGEIKSLRVKGSENELLTYMDRLGYS
ncbi:MAG: hypothetical protein FWE42_01640 [Defluviitaleaceae bacterium]|nr:hypothetical protein [Defluviitaleaceae bacterium]